MTAENHFLDAWRSALQQWETETNKLLGQAISSEGSAKALNGLLSGTVQMQAAFADAMAKALSALNLPSREDVVRLSEQVREIERKVDLVLAGRDAARPDTTPRPGRTRRPPSRETGDS